MKRSVSILLVLLLVCCCLSCLAETEYESPILFRNIPWGTDYDTIVADYLKDEVKLSNPDGREYWYKFDDVLFDESNWDDYYNAPLGVTTYARTSSLQDLKVAGYDVYSLYLKFVSLPGDDGLLVNDNQHTALYYAYYQIAPKDGDAAYADLLNKLTSIYGDVDLNRVDDSFAVYTQNVWYGADGTAVSLVRETFPSSSDYIYIKYSYRGGDELLKKAYAAVVLEEGVNAGNNTDGL